MTDETRSRIMRAVKRADTGPEIVARKVLHRMGLRFRIHRRDLPGTPDIVLPRHRAAIFVHGCFWHRHRGCPYATVPKTNEEYWLPKFGANTARDARKQAALEHEGWRVLVVWGCETRDPEGLEARLRQEFSLEPRGERAR